ncbi:uncharacterized protein LY89DRAFT_738929 [Mollisia scopiformis]|uniref:Uncharacterized protein n=1 Tax=Mollisia scopiformis TaxID=149040 RepID=A0A194WU60_MOLSC|nr:uncharacterized protein LY89DRAFT_738929 [Mollisia scopiformis]KUJ11495.1 hypothetical protein LY89DRAFT_738929 [Mollisia scopiformis]
MNFDMPENTLLNHILLFGGIQLTTQEWRDFLKTADDRNELFRWKSDGRGVVNWIEASPPVQSRNPPYIIKPIPIDLDDFKDLATTYLNWSTIFNDIDLDYLLRLITR